MKHDRPVRPRVAEGLCGSPQVQLEEGGGLAWWLRVASVHALSTSVVNSWGRCHCILQTRTLRPTEGQGLAHGHPADEKLG